MAPPSPDVVAARVRAALAYANIKLTDKGAPLSVGSISQATMSRIVSPANPRGASIEELREIASVCGVPRSFLEEGFSVPPSADERVADLEARLEAQETGTAALLQFVEQISRELEGHLLPRIEQSAAEALQLAHDNLHREGRQGSV